MFSVQNTQNLTFCLANRTASLSVSWQQVAGVVGHALERCQAPHFNTHPDKWSSFEPKDPWTVFLSIKPQKKPWC